MSKARNIADITQSVYTDGDNLIIESNDETRFVGFAGTGTLKRLVNDQRNYCWNPGPEVWQVSTGFSGLTSAGNLTADGWKFVISNHGTWNIGRGSVSGDGLDTALTNAGYTDEVHLYQHTMQCIASTGDGTVGSSDYALAEFTLEGYDLLQLFDGPYINVSFWWKSTVAGTFSVALRDAGYTATCVRTFTSLGSEQWQKVELSFPADTAPVGTWNYTNGTGMRLGIALAAGSSLTTSTIGSWTSGVFIAGTGQANGAANNGDYAVFSRVQIERGSSPIDFSPHSRWSFDDSLRKAQRYFFTTYPYGTTVGSTFLTNTLCNVTTTHGVQNFLGMPFTFPARMRTPPSVYVYAPNGATSAVFSSADVTNLSAAALSATEARCVIRNTASTGATSDLYFHMAADSRL